MTDPSSGSVSSADGTSIGYLQLGHGPGVVLLHGSMEDARSHLELATHLCDDFTVYLPDRRGRGSSGSCERGHGLAKEIEDVDALLTKTAAQYVFGVSSGAVLALHAALALPAVEKVAAYEPPLSVSRAAADDYHDRLERQLAAGDHVAMLVTGMKAIQAGPAWLRAMPDRMLKPLVRAGLRREERTATADTATMGALAPTLPCDFRVLAETVDRSAELTAIQADVLLLDGDRSQRFLRTAVDSLAETLPTARRVTFTGLDHQGSGNTSTGGHPDRVAAELLRFFA